MNNTKWTWDMLQKRVKYEQSPKQSFNTVEIELVERAIGHKIPPSYNEYLNYFGCGLMLGMIIVWVPTNDSIRDIRIRSSKEREFLLQESALNKDFLKHLIPFGTTDNGDVLCWDPAISDSSNEMAIFLIDSKLEYGFYAGNSLLSFFGDFCIDRELDKVDPRGKRATHWDLPLTFEPCRA